MLGSSEITIVRHVALWYYVLTGLTALVAVGWLSRRRLLGLGARLLVGGIAVNALWELLLFTVWGRRYETLVPVPIHAAYQSLTEFGPPLVIGVLLLDKIGAIDLSPWQETASTSLHSLLYRGTIVVVAVVLALCLVLAVRAPVTLSTPILVYREISMWYFVLTAGVTAVVLATAVQRAHRTALVLFVVLGVFNILFEIVGLGAGYRTYHGLRLLAAVFVGLTESGTAAALVWILLTPSVPSPAGRSLALSQHR